MAKFATLQRRRQRFRQKSLNFIVVASILLVPIFPATGLYAQRYTGVVVRGEIDTSTIITTTDGDDFVPATAEDFMKEIMQTDDLSSLVSTESTTETIAQETLPPENIEVPEAASQAQDPKALLYRDHTVTPRQTLGEISQKYGVSVDALTAANPGLTTDLKIDQKILIPKIQGVEYTVKQGDTLGVIAQAYGISSLYHILLANDLTDASKIRVGQKLLLPNPTKTPTTPAPKPATPQAKKKTTTKTDSTPQSITYGSYTLTAKVSSGCRNFAWGNCTCFVAKYKNVTWRGNAKQWLANAKKAGAATGSTPTPGAIIVYDGPGFPPAYGHVGIVMEVNDDGMIIKDMNYSGLNVITTRKEKFNNSAIKGYIYVD